MVIIGNIVKNFIQLKDTLTPTTDPAENQKKVLSDLLNTAKMTAFGKHYKFRKILASTNIEKAFSENVPYFDYSKINKQWWSRLHQGEEDVTWPGNPDYFALSSGTTGKKSKKIPVTQDMISSIRSAGIQQITALSNFELPVEFFEKGILMLGSSTDLKKTENHLEGEISGISASNIPFWFKGFYKPGEMIANIDDWDDRVQKIAEMATSWDIGAISGIPSWIELMLEKVINYNKVNNIHEIWPNLQVYTSGGVAFGPYKKSFHALMGRSVTVIDTYLASEGFIAFQSRPDSDAMKLITDNGIYFEFVPFKPEYILKDGSLSSKAPSVTLAEVELDQDYVLIMSTASGTWRYMIGDTIEFTDVKKAEIKITGRTKFFLNTVGSQLSVNKLDDGIQHLEQKFDIKIPEYTLSATKIEGEFYHNWYIGTTSNIPKKKLEKELDSFLKESNKNYKVARSKALKGIIVNAIKPEVFHDWSGHNKKKGGQVKMERVMGPQKFKEWKRFVVSYSKNE